MKDPNQRDPDRRTSGVDDSGEFSAAMARLEKAVQEIVTVTTGQLSERATSMLDETSKRLEAELSVRRDPDDEPTEAQQARRRRRRRSRHRMVDRAEQVNPRSGRLYRDTYNQKIGGVCAGLANYFGMQTWAVRLGALTGMLFMPTIIVPAYWIAYFIMDTPDSEERPSRRGRRRRRRSQAEKQASTAESGATSRRSSDANERFEPSRTLRYANADFTQAELRLRRLESFVTSDKYELHRELHKIEREGASR